MRIAALMVSALIVASCKRNAPPAVHVLVTNEDSGDVSILDAATAQVVATVPVGLRPRGLKLSRDGKTLYVALSGAPKKGATLAALAPRDADGIGVVDLASRKVAQVLHAGADPESFDLVAGGLVVSNEDSAQASIVDLQSGAIASVGVGGEPEGVSAHPDGKTVWITSEADSRIDVLDLAARAVIAKVPVGKRPRAIAFTHDGERAFVTCEQAGTVAVVDAKKHQPIAEIAMPAGARPMGIRIAPDGRMVWVSNGRARSVVAIDATSLAIVREVKDVGDRPWGLDLTPDGQWLFVANGPSNDVAMIDTAKGRLVRRIPVGKSPWGIAISP